MEYNNRILIVDDTEEIHEDFEKILLNKELPDLSEIDEMAATLFDGQFSGETSTPGSYILENAYQGTEAVEKVKAAKKAGKPFALCFMDVRMPPGIDGVETIQRIWEIDSGVEMVICTAYSDYSWDLIIQNLGSTDRLLFLQKPFNIVEVKQLALSLVKKWNLNYELQEYVERLEQTMRVEGRSPFDNFDETASPESSSLREYIFIEDDRDFQTVLSAALTETYKMSKRESEVCRLLIQGSLYKEIASQLSISINTVGYHVHNVYKKAGVQNVAELIHKLRV